MKKLSLKPATYNLQSPISVKYLTKWYQLSLPVVFCKEPMTNPTYRVLPNPYFSNTAPARSADKNWTYSLAAKTFLLSLSTATG